MKIYGRKHDDDLEFFQETNIIGDPDALREFASFLYRCADSIEDEGESWEHDRFESSDAVSAVVTVFNPALITEIE